MLEKLPFQLILGSGSPRRKAILEELKIPFTVDVKPIKEDYPPHLKKGDIPIHISEVKADAFTKLKKNQVVLTADTVVWHKDKALGKPANREEAFAMLRSLSGHSHEVFSAFCLKSYYEIINVVASCQVTFKELTDDEINYYINHFKPFDKAGAYGIQDWIGQIGVTKMHGSFYTVMGLPADMLYENLKYMVDNW